MYPAAQHKIPNKTIDSSQLFERLIFHKQPKIINKIAESWDKNTNEYLEQVCPKQEHDFLS